jgi:predicted GH43/DUF377 family glycosyl hydrolase
MLKRYKDNPIIGPDPNAKWYSKKAYNSTVIKRDGTYHLLFRGVGDDWVSRIMRAESSDGINFTIDNEPVIAPEFPWEAKGCEDPRIIYLQDKYWVTYTAFDGTTGRSAIASSDDLQNWQKHHLMFPQLAHIQRENLPGDWSKSAAIFPEKIDDRYLLLFGDNHIWSATSQNLIDWESSPVPVISARPGYFDAAYIEMGPPPIKTKHGWLALYHGINEFSDHRVYSLGAALLSPFDPLRIIWRCSKPILEPTEPYEIIGLVDLVPGGFEALKNININTINELSNKHVLGKAVFCCGAILEDETVKLYYAAADTRICLATIDLDSIFNS